MAVKAWAFGNDVIFLNAMSKRLLITIIGIDGQLLVFADAEDNERLAC